MHNHGRWDMAPESPACWCCRMSLNVCTSNRLDAKNNSARRSCPASFGMTHVLRATRCLTVASACLRVFVALLRRRLNTISAWKRSAPRFWRLISCAWHQSGRDSNCGATARIHSWEHIMASRANLPGSNRAERREMLIHSGLPKHACGDETHPDQLCRWVSSQWHSSLQPVWHWPGCPTPETIKLFAKLLEGCLRTRRRHCAWGGVMQARCQRPQDYTIFGTNLNSIVLNARLSQQCSSLSRRSSKNSTTFTIVHVWRNGKTRTVDAFGPPDGGQHIPSGRHYPFSQQRHLLINPKLQKSGWPVCGYYSSMGGAHADCSPGDAPGKAARARPEALRGYCVLRVRSAQQAEESSTSYLPQTIFGAPIDYRHHLESTRRVPALWCGFSRRLGRYAEQAWEQRVQVPDRVCKWSYEPGT